MSSLDLMTALSISEIKFDLAFRQETFGVARGDIRVADIGPALWSFSADCSVLLQDQLLDIAAIIGGMGGARGTFFAFDPMRPAPKADPTGAGLSGATVRVNSVNVTDRSLMSLRGLPAGYVLSRGDYISFNYANPVTSTASVALHRVTAASVTANGSGITAEFAVHPPVLPGVVTGASGAICRLTNAYAEFRLKPGSFDPTGKSGLLATARLEASQFIPN